MPTFIPGYKTGLTINLTDVGVIGNVTALNRAKASQPKPVFGSAFRNEIPGQASGTLSASGHVSVEDMAAMETIFNSDVAVAYVLQVGDATDATDAGQFAGNLVVTTYELSADAEGEWDWSLEATLDGAPTYTPPTP